VSAKSEVTTLSKVQMADIFLGKATHFPGGVTAVPIDLEEGSSTRDDFYMKLMGKSAAQLKAYWTKVIFTGRGEPPREAPNSVVMKKLLLENSAAIGYLEANLVDASLRVVTVVGE
jgi:ABC-type phosphate transport system substrate-binding protein